MHVAASHTHDRAHRLTRVMEYTQHRRREVAASVQADQTAAGQRVTHARQPAARQGRTRARQPLYAHDRQRFAIRHHGSRLSSNRIASCRPASRRLGTLRIRIGSRRLGTDDLTTHTRRGSTHRRRRLHRPRRNCCLRRNHRLLCERVLRLRKHPPKLVRARRGCQPRGDVTQRAGGGCRVLGGGARARAHLAHLLPHAAVDARRGRDVRLLAFDCDDRPTKLEGERAREVAEAAAHVDDLAAAGSASNAVGQRAEVHHLVHLLRLDRLAQRRREQLLLLAPPARGDEGGAARCVGGAAAAIELTGESQCMHRGEESSQREWPRAGRVARRLRRLEKLRQVCHGERVQAWAPRGRQLAPVVVYEEALH